MGSVYIFLDNSSPFKSRSVNKWSDQLCTTRKNTQMSDYLGVCKQWWCVLWADLTWWQKMSFPPLVTTSFLPTTMCAQQQWHNCSQTVYWQSCHNHLYGHFRDSEGLMYACPWIMQHAFWHYAIISILHMHSNSDCERNSSAII